MNKKIIITICFILISVQCVNLDNLPSNQNATLQDLRNLDNKVTQYNQDSSDRMDYMESRIVELRRIEAEIKIVLAGSFFTMIGVIIALDYFLHKKVIVTIQMFFSEFISKQNFKKVTDTKKVGSNKK